MTEREERSTSMTLLKVAEGAEANYLTMCSVFFWTGGGAGCTCGCPARITLLLAMKIASEGDRRDREMCP